MQITDGKRDEIYDIAVFLDVCWKAEYSQIVDPGYLDNMSVERRHERLCKWFDAGEKDFLVMRDGETLAGACVFGKSYTEGFPDDGEISAIYLRSDYIGKGYGHSLFTKAEKALASKAYKHFVLDVLSGNTRAIRFYLAHGYDIMAESSVKLGDREYPLTIMRRPSRDGTSDGF